MRRVLVAVTWCSHGKDYVVPKFFEMAPKVFDGANVVFFGDMVPPSEYEHVSVDWGGIHMAEDMLLATREVARQKAVREGYDVLMWHGIDALWQSGDDFRSIVGATSSYRPVVAPVISARADSRFWIARRFDEDEDGRPLESQTDIPLSELESGPRYLPSGFPGADNISIDRRAFEVISFDGHMRWYDRVRAGLPNLCAEEWWCFKAARNSIPICVDTETFVWHVHEDGVARMLPGIEVPMEGLKWD